MSDLSQLYQAFQRIGEDPARILTPDTAHVVADGHRVLSRQSVTGVQLEVSSGESGIRAKLVVEEGQRIGQPIHLCFGLFERFGVQNVDLDIRLQANSRVTLWSHCLFTVPDVARHAMTARVHVQAGAELVYNEAHYHGLSGGIEVVPRAEIKLGRGARYLADFSLVQGRVGKLDIDYAVDVGEDAVAELTSKVYGHVADDIRIRERIDLNGDRARGLIKSRVAVEDEATAEVIGATCGNSAGARGHVDCLEIVRGNGVVSAIPEVRVTHPEAKVTHEAAIGSVDQMQLETLMARGLNPEDAIDVIVRGMLR